jgi:hypothetical protein
MYAYVTAWFLIFICGVMHFLGPDLKQYERLFGAV